MMSATAWAQCDPGQESCSITITGQDSYGDGWNGASIAIWQDTVYRGSFTVSGSNNTQTIPACAGYISFSWTPGTYNSECSFTIVDSLGVVLYTCTDGSMLSSGTFCNTIACPTCLSPIPQTDGTTSDSAYLSWNGNDEATGWLYQYTTASYPLSNWTFTTDTTVQLSELNPNTRYHFFVKTICGLDDTSAAAELIFTTQCGDMVVPFSEGFENNGNMPACWTLWEHSVYSSYGYLYYYPEIYGYNSHGGSYHLECSSDYGPNSIISPRVFLPANQVEVVFWGYGNGGAVAVGYTTTDDSATAVFHQVSSFALTDDWQRYTADFGGLTITDSIYVALRVAGNLNYSYSHIDDITIRHRSSCPNVDSLRVVATAPGQITFTWSDATSTAWEIAYGPVGFDPDFDTVRVPVSTNPATLTGLSDNMTYDFYVRSVCGTEHGYWSLPVTARPNVYDMHMSGTDTIYACGTSIADPGGVAGEMPTYIYSTLVVYPSDSTMTVGLMGNVVLDNATLDIYEGVGIYGRLLASLTGTVNNVNVISSGGPLTLDLSTSYNNVDGFLLTTYCSPLPTCTDVYDVAISNITGNSAMVRWNYGNYTTPDYFNIRVIDTAGENELNFTAPDSVRSFTLTGLEQMTNYIVIVQTSCDNGDTSNNVNISFRTKCLSGGEMLVGDPASTMTDYRLPYYTYYHGLSQQIFDSAEVAGFDTIFGIKFYTNSAIGLSRDIDVYIDTTYRSSYNSLSDYIAQSLSHRKFSGTVTIVDGWNEIPFANPFAYNGNGNIVLTFVDNTGTYASSIYGLVHNTTSAKSLMGYDYSSPLDPSDSLCLSSLYYYNTDVLNMRSNITFLTPCGDASCVPPSVTVTQVDSGSVTLSWVPGLYESNWSVEYREEGDTNWQVHTYDTYFDTAVVSGLLPATTYRFRVTSLCGDTVASALAIATTRCAPVHAIPFYENFEHFSGSSYDNDLQQCWYRYTTYSSTYTTYYYPYVDNYTGHNSSSSMYFAASPDYYYSMLVLPEMGAPVDTLTISFYMMGSYTAYDDYQLQIGVMTDPTDNSSFVLLDTARFSGMDYEWQFFEFDLDHYNGNGHFIALRTDPHVGYGFNVDDIRVKYINPCKKVLNPSARNATINTVTLTFTDTTNAGSYTILYGMADSIGAATDTIQTTATSVLLSGLTPATGYHAWVRTNCGGFGSEWVEFPAFATRCNPIAIDDTTEYYTDFESGLDNCMAQERMLGSIDWEYSTTSSNPTGAYSGGHIGQLYNASRQGETTLLLPNFNCTNLSRDAELTFWHAQVANGGGQDELRVLYRTSDTAQWTLLDSFTTELTSWTQHFVSLPNSAHCPNYQIALKGNCRTGYGVKIDDLSVHVAPSCDRPSDLAVTNITEESAVVSWTGNSASYTVNYRVSGSWSWRSLTTNAPSIVLTGLLNLTNYEIRIKGDCSRTDHSLWSESAFFITDACVISENHYSYDPADFVPAMSNNAPANTYYSYTYSEVLVDSAQLAGLTDIIAFGFNPTNINTRNSFGDCQVYFGTTTDTVLTSFKYDTSFVLVYQGSLNFNSLGWQYFRLDTTYVYDGHSNLIVAINRSGSTTNYNELSRFAGHVTNCVKNRTVYDYSPINPISVNLQPLYYIVSDTVAPNYAFLSCAPYCYAPEITSTAVTTSQATLTWTADSPEAEVSYRDASTSEWSDPVAVTGFSYTFADLNHTTTYQLRVRQNCTVDSLGFSNWTFATVTTDPICSIPTDLQVSDISNARATITWSSPLTDNLWEIHVWGNDYDQMYRSGEPSISVRGLQPGNRYAVAVRTLCGPNHQTLGDYSETIEFTTPICGPVAGLRGEALGNAVRLHWAPGINNAGFWEIQYGRQGYLETEILGSVISPDTVFTVRNLVPNFNYAFRVRSLCGAGWESDWSGGELVITTGEATGIDDVDAHFQCTIHPNPATQATTITVSGVEGKITISVVDMNGRVVSKETLSCAADCEKALDVAGLSEGAYFVHIVGDNVNSVRKLIVR